MSDDAPEPIDVDRIIMSIRRLPLAEHADGIRERCGGDHGLALRVRIGLESDVPEAIDDPDAGFLAAGDETGPNRLQMLFFSCSS